MCCQGWLNQYFKEMKYFLNQKTYDLLEIFNTYKIIEPYFNLNINYNKIFLSEKNQSKILQENFELIKKYAIERENIKKRKII